MTRDCAVVEIREARAGQMTYQVGTDAGKDEFFPIIYQASLRIVGEWGPLATAGI